MTTGLLGVALFAGTAFGAHNGNNRAELAGTTVEPDASGVAIVNYSEGQGTFNGNVTVSNLIPGATYTFAVRRGAGTTYTTICTGTADADGTFICSAQGLTLPGFTTAVVLDAGGVEVARGVFERRGNCRDPEQAGSQCEAQRP